MRLETDRLVLRRWRVADRDAFAALCADPEVMLWLGGVLTRADADARIDRVEASFEVNGHGRYLLERKADGAFLGWCGIMLAHESWPMAGHPEIGWRLARHAWGAGYATEAARAALDDGFQRLGFQQVLALTSANNQASQAVMGRLGMVREPHRDFRHAGLAADDPFGEAIAYMAYP